MGGDGTQFGGGNGRGLKYGSFGAPNRGFGGLGANMGAGDPVGIGGAMNAQPFYGGGMPGPRRGSDGMQQDPIVDNSPANLAKQAQLKSMGMGIGMPAQWGSMGNPMQKMGGPGGLSSDGQWPPPELPPREVPGYPNDTTFGADNMNNPWQKMGGAAPAQQFDYGYNPGDMGYGGSAPPPPMYGDLVQQGLARSAMTGAAQGGAGAAYAAPPGGTVPPPPGGTTPPTTVPPTTTPPVTPVTPAPVTPAPPNPAQPAPPPPPVQIPGMQDAFAQAQGANNSGPMQALLQQGWSQDQINSALQNEAYNNTGQYNASAMDAYRKSIGYKKPVQWW